jgi:hypothetical protein
VSDSNRIAQGIAQETTYGVIPTTPAFEPMRITQSGLQFKPKTGTSDEIRSDAQLTDLILLGMDANGQVGYELSYGTLDSAIASALRSAWQAKPVILNITADTSITDAGTTANTYAVAANGTNFKLGHLCRATGFTNSANNQIFRVASSTATTVVGTALALTAEPVPPAGSQLQVIGFQGASADLAATTVGGNALTSTALDFTTLGLVVGEWVKIGGTAVGEQFATAGNNDLCRISAIAATRLSFDIVPAAWATDAGTGKTLKVWLGDYIRNGTTPLSHTIERRYLDHSPVTYEYFRGMGYNTLEFDAQPEDKFKVLANFIGQDVVTQTTRTAGATDLTATTSAVLNTSANVGTLYEGGAVLPGKNYVMSAKITINNNVRSQPGIGYIGGVGLGWGEFNVQIALGTYFGSKAVYDKVVNNTKSSFMLAVKRPDENNRTILFDCPRLKYADGGPSVGGKNQDVMANLTAQVLMHETLGYTIQLQRFPYLE